MNGNTVKRILVYFVVGSIGALLYLIVFRKPPTPDDEWDFLMFGSIILVGAYLLEQLLFRKNE